MKSEFIRSVPLFASLTDEEFKSLEHILLVRRYSKGQVIFQEQDTGNYMYIVLAGKLKVTKSTGSGRESILAIHQAGDFFGEMSLLDGKTSPATVSAREDCKIATISKADFFLYLMKNEKVVQQIIRVLCRRLRQGWGRLHMLSHGSAEVRICEGLLSLSRRYGLQDGGSILINMKFTHQELAEMAGTSRETVTRTLTRLQKKGLLKVDHDGHLVLVDPKSLSLVS